MDKWYTASRASWNELATALRDPRLRYVYVERLEDIALTWRDALLTGTVPLQDWTHGRAFGSELEVAWWKRGDHVEARAIVAAGGPPQGVSWLPYPTDEWEPVAQDGLALLLVGERDPSVAANPPRWSTARIPRYLDYPASESAHQVSLTQQAYQHKGMIVATRLVDVKEAVHG